MGQVSQMHNLKEQQQGARRDDEEARKLVESERVSGNAPREQQRPEASEARTRLMTLGEHIGACHIVLSPGFTVKTDAKSTERSSITSPHTKWCPKNLKSWHDFLDQQKLTLGTLYASFPAERRVFENQSFLAFLGKQIAQRPIADETTLESFLHDSVEVPVKAIIEELKQEEEVRRAFQICDGVIFESHPHALSDVAEWVIEKKARSASPRTRDHGRDPRQLRPDQICIYRSDDTVSSRRTMLYICEYKPPHKLTAQHLRAGLRDMHIQKEVVNRRTIPTSVEPDALFQYHAAKLTASAITQTYHHMIESGLEHGLLTTGEAIVFLKVDWNEPETLYYHLAEPGPDILAHPNDLPICTALGQHLAFTLMALGSPGVRREIGQEERLKAMKNLKTWAEDFESIIRSIPENYRSVLSDYSPGQEPTTYKNFDRSLVLPCKRVLRVTNSEDDNRSKRKYGRREPLPSDYESAPRPSDTPTPAERNTGQGSRRSQSLALRESRGGGDQARQYCTQKCLLGMAEGSCLDPDCPNVALHYKRCDLAKGPAGSRHPVTYEDWLRLLRDQLEQSIDEGISRLWKSGTRGVLFQVTLLAHGYTFVAKGTVKAFVEDLEHEAAVYERLRPIQGVNVPVFLGAIDLRSMDKTYHYDHRVYVKHMIFMSWGGHSIDQARKNGDMDSSLADEAIRSLEAMHKLNVIHIDVQRANMLFNPETKGVMMIDFEQAELSPDERALELKAEDIQVARDCLLYNAQ